MSVLKVTGGIVFGLFIIGALADGGDDKGLVTKTSTTGCQVTLANYNKLYSGMGYANAVRTLGCPGQEMSRVEIPGTPTTVMYAWDGSSGWGANMNATFQDDSLVSKAQFGLE